MRFAINPRLWSGRARTRARLMVGLFFAFAFHGTILSLQFGAPGLGLPGMERRTEPLTVALQLAPVGVAPDTVTEAFIQPLATSTLVVPSVAPVTSLPVDAPALNAAPKEHAGMTLLPMPKAAAPPSATSIKELIVPKPQQRAPRPKAANPPQRVDEISMPEVIAKTIPKQDDFVLPAPTHAIEDESAIPPVEAAQLQDAEAAPIAPIEDLAVEAKEAKKAEEQVEQAAARQAVNEVARLAQIQAMKKIEDAKLKRELKEQQEQQQLAQQQRIQTEKIEQQAALALQKQAFAAQKLEQDTIARRAGLLAAQKNDEAKIAAAKMLEIAQLDAQKLEEQKVEQRKEDQRRTLELAAKKQAEQEAAQQLLLTQARQKQIDELAAKQKAQLLEQTQQAQQLRQEQDSATRRAADALAAQQRLQDRSAVASESGAGASATSSPNAGDAGNGNRGADKSDALAASPGGSLASKALEQARKGGLLRFETPLFAAAAEHADKAARRWTYSSKEHDIGLNSYIEGWRQKIERNGRLNYVQSATELARGDPIVTVAIRSDGSIEDIVFNRSSGRPELDDAVRRILRLNARYSIFPPSLARKFDVIEIRRVWNFDDALKIIEEVR
ncbi:MAG: TonB C-terminal domain-containing protein [Pseudomonadota bacterium]